MGFLVLSRHTDESIIIETSDGLIEVLTVGTQPDRVRLGFKAPANVKIHRKEVHEAIQREKKR